MARNVAATSGGAARRIVLASSEASNASKESTAWRESSPSSSGEIGTTRSVVPWAFSRDRGRRLPTVGREAQYDAPHFRAIAVRYVRADARAGSNAPDPALRTARATSWDTTSTKSLRCASGTSVALATPLTILRIVGISSSQAAPSLSWARDRTGFRRAGSSASYFTFHLSGPAGRFVHRRPAVARRHWRLPRRASPRPTRPSLVYRPDPQ